MNEEIARLYHSNYLSDFEAMDKNTKIDVKVPKSYLKGYLLNNNFVKTPHFSKKLYVLT
jgi:hypothetical protein